MEQSVALGRKADRSEVAHGSASCILQRPLDVVPRGVSTGPSGLNEDSDDKSWEERIADICGALNHCGSCWEPLPWCHCGSENLCNVCSCSMSFGHRRPREGLTAEWNIIEEALHAGLKTMQGNFPKIYKGFLEEADTRSPDTSLNILPVARRSEAIEQVCEFTLSGLWESISSEKIRAAKAYHHCRVQNIVRDGVDSMFAFVEGGRSQVEACGEQSSCAFPARLQGVTKRGMAQPRSKRRK